MYGLLLNTFQKLQPDDSGIHALKAILDNRCLEIRYALRGQPFDSDGVGEIAVFVNKYLDLENFDLHYL